MGMPTAQSVGGNSHASSINAFNLQLRSQPWYQAWFRQQGLDPNRVQLSKSQRQQLESVLAQHGMPLTGGMNIDPAGNLNTAHGFASQPTWLKTLEIAAPIAVGGYFAAPAIAGALGGGGGVSAAVGAPAATEASIFGSSAAAAGNAAAEGLVAPAVARGAGFGIGKILTSAAPALVNAGMNIYGTRAATSANREAAQVQAQTAQNALDYTKTHDAQQRQDFLDTQNRNFALYQQAQARLDPYRRVGQGSLDQLMRPIPGVGTLGARM